MESAQQLMATLGLSTPALRFAAVTTVTGGILVAVQPDLMFTDGAPRPWSVLDDDPEGSLLPWWGVAVGAGFVASTFL